MYNALKKLIHSTYFIQRIQYENIHILIRVYRKFQYFKRLNAFYLLR